MFKPQPTDGTTMTVPLFPLPDLFLFPNTLVGLLIFEPRYLQMVEDMLDGPGRMVLGTVLPDHVGELPGAPPVYPVGGLGEIGKHERLPDGRFFLFVMGLERVAISEVGSERLYRQVQAEPVVEAPLAAGAERELRPLLEQALDKRSSMQEESVKLLTTVQLTDILLLHMKLPSDRMMQIYAELDLETRIREVLREAGSAPLRQPNERPFRLGSDEFPLN